MVEDRDSEIKRLKDMLRRSEQELQRVNGEAAKPLPKLQLRTSDVA